MATIQTRVDFTKTSSLVQVFGRYLRTVSYGSIHTYAIFGSKVHEKNMTMLRECKEKQFIIVGNQPTIPTGDSHQLIEQ